MKIIANYITNSRFKFAMADQQSPRAGTMQNVYTFGSEFHLPNFGSVFNEPTQAVNTLSRETETQSCEARIKVLENQNTTLLQKLEQLEHLLNKVQKQASRAHIEDQTQQYQQMNLNDQEQQIFKQEFQEQPITKNSLDELFNDQAIEKQDKQQDRYWSDEDHIKFLRSIQQFGRNGINSIVQSLSHKDVRQVRSHCQKYFIKLQKLIDEVKAEVKQVKDKQLLEGLLIQVQQLELSKLSKLITDMQLKTLKAQLIGIRATKPDPLIPFGLYADFVQVMRENQAEIRLLIDLQRDESIKVLPIKQQTSQIGGVNVISCAEIEKLCAAFLLQKIKEAGGLDEIQIIAGFYYKYLQLNEPWEPVFYYDLFTVKDKQLKALIFALCCLQEAQ